MTFRPQPKPGRSRIIDERLLQFIKTTIARCEWPEGCRETRVSNLAAHHLFGRGLGGGKRSDHPDDVVILCHKHHNMGPGVHAHHPMWWNREGQKNLQRFAHEKRRPEELAALSAYLVERGFRDPHFTSSG